MSHHPQCITGTQVTSSFPQDLFVVCPPELTMDPQKLIPLSSWMDLVNQSQLAILLNGDYFSQSAHRIPLLTIIGSEADT